MSDLTALLLGMHSAEQIRDKYLRAPMGYPGAKSRSIAQLIKHLPVRKTWIDVCGGTASVSLARDSCDLEVYNDIHSGLVAFYRCIRDRSKCKELIDRLNLSPPCSREEFIWCRESWESNQLDDVERAARWYYSVQTSFNSKGWSFGRCVKGKAQGQKLYNNLELFWPIHNRIKNWQIENMDWRLILQDYCKAGEDVVFYIDPPYWSTSGNYKYEWRKEEHSELCERIQNLNGAFVAVSGYDHSDHPYNKYKFWTRKESWEVQLSMTGFAFTETNNLAGKEHVMDRSLVTESLWIYDPE